MGWRIPWRLCPNNAVFHCLIIGLAVCQVFPMEVRTSSEVEAVNGSSVTLTCTFKSSSQISSRVSVDWSYRPLSGGPTRSFFYFSSTPHLSLQGQFKGRVSQIRLSVVPKQLAVRFTDVAVLMGLVLLPSAIIAPLLLGRMWCCSKSCGVQRAKPVPSPIEVKEGEAAVYMDPTHKEKHITCCELYCRDFDDEYYIHDEMLQGGATDAETEC
ncbi:hypothetical protein ANANG_G00238690 [Anguilla anguilla]|uniref:Ig-like domain-containing protein n=1 Tax=Anguilla anguilla TaxID=7936 RepID=A0A9D3LX49_ANGAN|nr:hypothetical protein ANANG_G00238690 [Anguilla anguilla]